MTPGPRALFQQFSEHLSSDKELSAQLKAWAGARDQWRKNWTACISGAPEKVLRLLVPHPVASSQNHWIHPIADEAAELDSWTKRWNGLEGRAEQTEIATAFVRTIAEIESNAANASDACADLAKAAGAHEVPLAALTPSLSSLNPSRFVVLCDGWLRVLGQYEGADLSKNVAAYPDLNANALRWLAAAEEDAATPVFAGSPRADRFGVFCSWVARTHAGSISGTRFAVSKKQYKQWPPMW